jgi:uncharacterized membrane protein
MVWRGSSNVQDRIYASLTYLVPILEVLMLGGYLIKTIPILGLFILPLLPLLQVYHFSIGGFPIIQIGVFLGLYLGVVRNETLRYLLRFYAMQSLLLAIIVALFSALLSGIAPALLLAGGAVTLIVGTLSSVIFLGIIAASIFSIIQAARGLYAEIPFISEAAYSQIR